MNSTMTEHDRKVTPPGKTGPVLTRRRFTVGTGLAGAGILLLPSGLRAGQGAPSRKLNIALIGVGGRGTFFYDTIAGENVVALCDINELQLARALQRFPRARTYIDWRKCLEDREIEAVVICTADHTHAFIANWALNRNLHIYCEKPLGITVEEVRTVRAHWVAKKGKLATQVGTQGQAQPNYNRIRELVQDGAIGELQAAYAWGDRQIRRSGYWPAEGSPPVGFHFDLWLGPSPEHPYSPKYFQAKGAGCIEWNMFWDFGAGQVGDMGSHNMNMLWNAVDATLPVAIEAKGEPYNPEVTPVELECVFEHPANSWRGPITISWHQGGKLPRSPKNYIDLQRITDGVMYKGSRGFLIGNYRDGSRLLLPFGNDADLTYYKGRSKQTVIPDLAHFVGEWVEACKNPGRRTSCDFERHGNMIEQNLLGLVAFRAGKKILYDPVRGVVTPDAGANAFLRKEYRRGWTIDG